MSITEYSDRSWGGEHQSRVWQVWLEAKARKISIRYSLNQALATAGGVDPELNSSDITIFRRKGPSGMEAISVDYSAVLRGSVVGPQIEEDDVIVVPISTPKYIIKSSSVPWSMELASAPLPGAKDGL